MSITNITQIKPEKKDYIDCTVNILVEHMDGTIDGYTNELRRLADLASGSNEDSICFLLKDLADIIGKQ